MPDIHTAAITALTSASSSVGVSSTSNLNAVQVAVADVSQALQTLSHTIQTNATVTAPPTANTLTLATALGDVTITLPQLSAAEQQTLIQQLTVLAQTQRPLTLALQPGSPPTQAVLLIPTALPTVPAQQITPATTPQTLASGQTLTAVVLPNITPLTSETTPPPSSLAAIPLPSSSDIPAQPNAVLPPPALTSAPNMPPPPTPLSALLQPGEEITVHVDAILLPTQNAAPVLAANQTVATIIGTGTDGQLILKAGDATLFVKAQISAPIGTNIILTVDAAKGAPLILLPVIESTNFSTLPQALAALAQTDPQALQQLMATRIPQPTDMLPGALLFLFSAFKQGGAKGWLGEDAANGLSRGNLELLKSLSRELSGAGQMAQDSVVGNWHSYPIPLYSGQQFQALTLYVHNEREKRKNGESDAPDTGKVRFLIDMRLSKLGAMQLDGFVQPKKLDMVLRSEILLPEGIHNDLRLAYIKAVEAVGYTGSLNFQVGRGNWMVMQREKREAMI